MKEASMTDIVKTAVLYSMLIIGTNAMIVIAMMTETLW
ncbi:hypothetical protein X471_01161 [Bartonella bacilliformis str. Heidi Mejia]|uniref:Uncharacterized protein n=2 Tax=Bartonella bacilliformis TaxID=774 RepID=A1UTW7_BARBK|nr:hypothetical protein BARBAKC583_1161 [Bartonella bacilliformis KC583]EKS43058.1 hypothetical protein BbINS_05467 [Bartonella bacilliformis INS]EYS88602.1 hypothetical protein X472_01153 [Bartonella bacilliformis San Pedro600-02]EYS91026.1 hypothetical protein X471_01161 [Bartonella bacilliformis str. Heidi Mejia]EYS94420.1 hypothetical protein X470_01124 [Bartonella bacilliformis Peru-18]KEG15907.1 hypothetical protein H709_01023 [Bartonella bacilliformis CUSCO5]KEG16164.1 hypothetical pro